MQGFNILVFIIMLKAVHACTSFLYWLMLMLAFFCLLDVPIWRTFYKMLTTDNLYLKRQCLCDWESCNVLKKCSLVWRYCVKGNTCKHVSENHNKTGSGLDQTGLLYPSTVTTSLQHVYLELLKEWIDLHREKGFEAAPFINLKNTYACLIF